MRGSSDVSGSMDLYSGREFCWMHRRQFMKWFSEIMYSGGSVVESV